MIRKFGMIVIALCIFAAQPAMASDLGFKRGGVAASFVSPENIDGTLGIGVFADHGNLAPNWSLESRLDWWSHSEEFFNVDVSMTDITLGARTKYHFPVTSSSVSPFAGFGLGMHFLSAQVAEIDPFTGQTFEAEDSETRVGLDFGGGIATRLNPTVDMTFEGWYSIVSDMNQFALRFGISRAFGN